MPATIESITRIARETARETGEFDVLGVIPAEGGSYAEILLSVRGCRIDPCRFALGVLRNESEEQLRQTIVDQLRTHVRGRP